MTASKFDSFRARRISLNEVQMSVLCELGQAFCEPSLVERSTRMLFVEGIRFYSFF